MIKGLIFDIRGVVVKNVDDDIFAYIAEVMKVTEEAARAKIVDPLSMLERGEITTEEFLRQYSAALDRGFPEDPRLLTTPFEKAFSLDTTVYGMLWDLREQGLMLCALSNTHADDVQVYRNQGVYNPFNHVVLSCQVELVKPQEMIYWTCLTRMGLAPGNTVFIDDSEVNIKPAKELGINTILYQNPEQLLDELADYGVTIT